MIPPSPTSDISRDNSNVVFPYFKKFAPEIRAMIWEQHFLATISSRPRTHMLFA